MKVSIFVFVTTDQSGQLMRMFVIVDSQESRQLP